MQIKLLEVLLNKILRYSLSIKKKKHKQTKNSLFAVYKGVYICRDNHKHTETADPKKKVIIKVYLQSVYIYIYK